MKIWNQDNYQKAWNFASRIHNNQTLPGSEIPYINHLGLVAMEAMAAVAHGAIENPDLLVQCALLHDAIEDTATTFDDILESFSREVADGVLALTKNDKLTTKREQMIDSIQRIKKQPREVWMVKLCDRITNLQAPPAHWDKNKIASYQNEAQLIVDELGGASVFLSKRLSVKILDYVQFK